MNKELLTKAYKRSKEGKMSLEEYGDTEHAQKR